MIEINAKLLRGHVYLSGEIIECTITFTYPSISKHKLSQSHHDIYENLGWAAAQIYCQCFTDVKLENGQQTNATTTTTTTTTLSTSTLTALDTTPDRKGQIILTTKPKILFCDLKLSPGQSKTYIYREQIPHNSPPTYRGQLIKYSYKIIIGTQRINNLVKTLRIPIRILPIYDLNDEILCNETTEELTPTNPFLEFKQTETYIDFAIENLQNITARRNPNFFMITNLWGKVARFCLFKSTYKLGEDIIGTFDFTIATINCIQFSVSLQSEEIINLDRNKQQTRILTLSKHHDVCFGYKYQQLILPIPLHLTPEFQTDLVTLKWKLHFEFVTSRHKNLQLPTVDQGGWQAPQEIPVETMIWSLPIHLYSTKPIHVGQSLQNVMQHTLIIR